MDNLQKYLEDNIGTIGFEVGKNFEGITHIKLYYSLTTTYITYNLKTNLFCVAERGHFGWLVDKLNKTLIRGNKLAKI